MSAGAFLRSVGEICDKLAEGGHLLTWQSHKVVPLGNNYSRVTFASESPEYSPVGNDEVTYDEYTGILRNRQFSVLLGDGSAIQLSCTFKNGSVVANRYCYVPCPVAFDIEELQGEYGEFRELEDFLGSLDDQEFRYRLRTRPILRFEYDPDNEGDLHPASHLHMGKSCCRIAVSAPLTVEHFMRFVFKNFYPEVCSQTGLWAGDPPISLPRTLDASHREMHVSM